MSAVLDYLRGLAFAIAATAAFFATALILGLASSGSRVFFIGAAFAGGIAVLLPGGQKGLGTAGALSWQVVAVVAGITSGFGALEISGIAGGLVAAVWIYAGSPMMSSPVESVIGWGGLAAMLVAGVTIILLAVDGGTLGHDESAYALKGRSWLEGTPDTGWGVHRAPGLSLYAYAALAVGGEEPLLRVVGLVAVLGLAGAVWLLGSRMEGSWVGPVSAIAILAGPRMLRRGTEFLSDIPSAALLTACMVIIWVEMGQREKPSYRILWLLVPALLAFYVRYQSILSFGLIALAVLVLWWPKVRARPGPFLALAGLGILGLVPHLLYSIDLTGSPLGVIRATSAASQREFLGSGLIEYVGLLAWQLSGFIGPIAGLALIVGLVAFWRSPEQRRRLLFLAIPALSQIMILGVLAVGEPRFIFFPLALIVVGGVLAAKDLILRYPGVIARSLVAASAVLLVGSLALSVASARRAVDGRAQSNEPVELAAQELVELADDQTCGAMTSYLPQITFYSACSTRGFTTGLEAGDAVDRLQGETQFMVLIEDGKRQPAGEDLNELVAETVGSPLLIDGGSRDATVFTFSE